MIRRRRCIRGCVNRVEKCRVPAARHEDQAGTKDVRVTALVIYAATGVDVSFRAALRDLS